MKSQDYLRQISIHLSHLYSFARQMNELDFAGSLTGEFRGMQDAGWTTTITAQEVFHEISSYFDKKDRPKAEMRIVLLLYCQLAEAGGVYETIKNMMGIVTSTPYLLWPFKDLVRVKQAPKRIIGPNANATFRDLATTAKAIGLSKLSELLESVFRDDIRNGISHADYVIWNDGLRLRKRNGGYADKLSFEEVSDAISRGVGFFQILNEIGRASVESFDPPKEIIGRFSANPPMPWTVSFDPKTGSFSISGSSPGPVITPEYERQVAINELLGGNVLAVFTKAETPFSKQVDDHILSTGFEPNNVAFGDDELAALIAKVTTSGLWDERAPHAVDGDVLLASPWGFRWIFGPKDFDSLLPEPILNFQFG
ncbi:hypothetical protein [Mesorhizobium huakuii]|uniref:Uncharacterized protein n=1 Tax=Mesorhizobium huakuii TaxID=28104 RepID=A0ABZ0VPZ2_9HYPH|nr:hypothetical protein [Mesorhizobium huakuii]WQB99532.1 hypothetical protein U0R22_003713 [Mesorhizobium huakuii]